MTTINTVLAGDTKQVVAFRLPITDWHEDQIELPVVYKTQQPCPTVPRPRRLAFISRMAHLKFAPARAKTARNHSSVPFGSSLARNFRKAYGLITYHRRSEHRPSSTIPNPPGSDASRSISFIGLGNMGGLMATNLLAANFPLMIHDVRRESAEPLMKTRARSADSPTAMACTAAIIGTSLPGPKEIETAFYGKDCALRWARVVAH